MGYVFDFKDAGNYDAWFDKGQNRHCLDLEIKLILDFLSPEKGQRVHAWLQVIFKFGERYSSQRIFG